MTAVKVEVVELRRCEGCAVEIPWPTNEGPAHYRRRRYCSISCHAKRKDKYGSPLARFWKSVDVQGPEDCWPWIGTSGPGGYGSLTIDGKAYKAHRLSLTLRLKRPLGKGMQALHECDNPPCVNPAHLFEGTMADNMADKFNKGRESRGESHGNATITEALVKLIRERFAGGHRQADISRETGVSFGQVSAIVNRKAWKHVA